MGNIFTVFIVILVDLIAEMYIHIYNVWNCMIYYSCLLFRRYEFTQIPPKVISRGKRKRGMGDGDQGAGGIRNRGWGQIYINPLDFLLKFFVVSFSQTRLFQLNCQQPYLTFTIHITAYLFM